MFPGLKCNLHGDQGFVIIYNIMMYKFKQVHTCMPVNIIPSLFLGLPLLFFFFLLCAVGHLNRLCPYPPQEKHSNFMSRELE